MPNRTKDDKKEKIRQNRILHILGKPYAVIRFMRPAIFFERDGVLNLERVEGSHPVPPLSLNELQINTEALEPLRQLKAAGFLLIATTNQPGISQGTLSRQELDRIHAQLRQFFLLDDIFTCPHDSSDFCPCRKPRPGLLTEAVFKWHIRLDRSFVISNKWQDAEAALNAGCTSLLIQSPWISKGHHDIVLSNLSAAVEKITRLAPSQAIAV